MELWIRSQLKGSLVKVNDLRIMQLDKDGFRALIEKEAREGWCIVANDDPCIGTYKTKERALEVLDEIQEILCPKQPKAVIGKNVEFIPTLDYVYEMPKE